MVIVELDYVALYVSIVYIFAYLYSKTAHYYSKAILTVEADDDVCKVGEYVEYHKEGFDQIGDLVLLLHYPVIKAIGQQLLPFLLQVPSLVIVQESSIVTCV